MAPDFTDPHARRAQPSQFLFQGTKWLITICDLGIMIVRKATARVHKARPLRYTMKHARTLPDARANVEPFLDRQVGFSIRYVA